MIRPLGHIVGRLNKYYLHISIKNLKNYQKLSHISTFKY
jgi:hypothetical protein